MRTVTISIQAPEIRIQDLVDSQIAGRKIFEILDRSLETLQNEGLYIRFKRSELLTDPQVSSGNRLRHLAMCTRGGLAVHHRGDWRDAAPIVRRPSRAGVCKPFSTRLVFLLLYLSHSLSLSLFLFCDNDVIGRIAKDAMIAKDTVFYSLSISLSLSLSLSFSLFLSRSLCTLAFLSRALPRSCR